MSLYYVINRIARKIKDDEESIKNKDSFYVFCVPDIHRIFQNHAFEIKREINVESYSVTDFITDIDISVMNTKKRLGFDALLLHDYLLVVFAIILSYKKFTIDEYQDLIDIPMWEVTHRNSYAKKIIFSNLLKIENLLTDEQKTLTQTHLVLEM